jgi:SAM-dependent methyltransferase
VLDIGIGAGWTTVYVGIDFSPVFIHFVNSSTQIDATLCDMRDLCELNAEAFDFVMGSFNVLDITTLQDRLLTLTQVHRVLKPEGISVLSCHNRTYSATVDYS